MQMDLFVVWYHAYRNKDKIPPITLPIHQARKHVFDNFWRTLLVAYPSIDVSEGEAPRKRHMSPDERQMSILRIALSALGILYLQKSWRRFAAHKFIGSNNMFHCTIDVWMIVRN